MFSGLAAQHPGASSLQSTMGSPFNTLSPGSHAYGASPAASMIFSHNNQHSAYVLPTHLSQTPPTPSLLSAFSANTLLRADRLRLIASMFSQMCEAVAVCHEAGISHRDIKPENFICCDSIDLETVAENEARALGISNGNRGDSVQAKRKVIVKLTDFGLATTAEDCDDMSCGSKPYMSYGKSDVT
jgi:serine/threonine protein kinase